jgi:hypothetical protein
VNMVMILNDGKRISQLSNYELFSNIPIILSEVIFLLDGYESMILEQRVYLIKSGIL